MARKDYALIAAALARTRPTDGTLKGFPMDAPERQFRLQWNVTRDAIIGALAADNPAFDRVRFVKATEL